VLNNEKTGNFCEFRPDQGPRTPDNGLNLLEFLLEFPCLVTGKFLDGTRNSKTGTGNSFAKHHYRFEQPVGSNRGHEATYTEQCSSGGERFPYCEPLEGKLLELNLLRFKINELAFRK
jgi:hypothetical protein